MMKMSEEHGDKIVKPKMKYLYTMELPTGELVDVYEETPNIYRYVFRGKKKETEKKGGGIRLEPKK